MALPWGPHGTKPPARRTLDPKLDVVFCMLLGREKNRPVLLALLNAVLQPLSPIATVDVLNSEPEKATPGDKDVVLDIRLRLDSGEQIDVEMQCRWHRALPERLLFYWARMHAGQLEQGEDYTDLRRSLVIVFADFTFLGSPRFHSVFQVREQHTQQLLTDQLELHVLELPKLETASDRNDEPELARWCRFLSATTDAELDELAMDSPTLKQAKEALEELSQDPQARFRAEQRKLSRFTYQMMMNDSRAEGRAEGLAEGKAEGLAEGKAEGLLAVLAARGIAVDPDHAALIRSCRDLPQLHHWLQRAASVASCEDLLRGAR